jgi:hypothetical protein
MKRSRSRVSLGLHGYGPRVAEPGLGLIGSYLWSGPYEEIRLKGR